MSSSVLSRLEYALDKLHDTVLEAAVLNTNVDSVIHSQCDQIKDLISRIQGSDMVGSHLSLLFSKYSDILEDQKHHNNDIEDMLNMFDNFLKDAETQTAPSNTTTTAVTAKKVRFNDIVEAQSPPQLTRETFEPYHDEIESSSSTTITSANDNTVPLNYNQQNTVLQKQDIQLTTLSRSMEYTHSLSQQMNEEITSQNNTVLTDLEANLDHGQQKLNRIMNHRIIRDVDLNDKTGDKICMIILVLILILLFLLIVL